MKGGRFLWGLLVGIVLGSSASWVLLDVPRPAISTSGVSEIPASESLVRVEAAIDGDTVRLETGEPVRLLGMDTPEKGEPYFEEASRVTRSLLIGQPVRLILCTQRTRDPYDRLLAFVQSGDRDPGLELLQQGLARTLFIPPCGLDRASLYRGAEREAFRAGRGIWSLQNPRRVPHEEAHRYIGSLMTVTGRVLKVHTGPKAIHLNFGEDYRTDFTVVIYRKNLTALLGEGLEPVTSYAGRIVEATGYLRSYKGPEIIIDSAEQLVGLALEDGTAPQPRNEPPLARP